MEYTEKLNAILRFSIYIAIVLFVYNRNINIRYNRIDFLLKIKNYNYEIRSKYDYDNYMDLWDSHNMNRIKSARK